MGNEYDYKDFLEGQYDGCIPLRALQEAQDNHRATELAQSAEKKMEEAWKSEEARIAKVIEGTDKVLEEVMNAYLAEDKFYQYLVDGAILQCDQATVEDFKLPNGGDVVLEKVTDQSDGERCQMILRVSENVRDNASESSMTIGGRAYATVKDTVKYRNIIVPCCNCKQPLNRMEEAERIKADPERNKHGVCRHLMQLNDEWRNLWKPGQSYLSKTNRTSSAMTVGFGELNSGNHLEDALGGEPEMAPGITMTSMLFCKHGGIIQPVTSGQSEFFINMEVALQAMTSYLQGELMEEDIEKYIAFVSENCGLKIARIGECEFKGRDVERFFDDYIVAWSFYWNIKINQGVFGDSRILIRPDVIKAMIMYESSWGEEGDKNSARDVMQCLYPGDYGLWTLAYKDPTEPGKWHKGTTEARVVCVKDGEDPIIASMRPQFNMASCPQMNDVNFHEGLGILNSRVITTIGDSENKWAAYKDEYLIHYDEVTPELSIACSIAYLEWKIKETGSEKAGVAGYNGGGAEKKTGEIDAYLNTINKFLGYLEYEDGSKPELLMD